MRRATVPFVLAVLALDAIGYGLIMPVMPDLLREVSGADLPRAALWAGIMTGGFAVMQFLFGPVLGNLSDRFGRKPVLLVSLAVLTADYLVLALAGSIALVLAARLATGAASATYGTAVALLADITPPEGKARRFGLIGAAYGLGFVLGPVLGGLLAGWGTRAPFLAAAAIAALNLGFGALALRETLAPGLRRPFRLRRANPLAAFAHLGRLPGLGPYLAAYTLHEFAFLVFPVIWAWYAIARFGWSAGQIGLSLALYGLCFALVQGGLLGPAARRWGRGRAMIAGAGASALAMAALGLGGQGGVALALIPLAALGGLVVPALRAELSDRVPADRQGELQGALASLRALGMIAAPLLYTAVFAAAAAPDSPLRLPGAPFLLAAALNLAALAALLRANARPA